MADKKLSFAKNATYNTIGTIINSFCLWLTTLVVVRLGSDYINAGIWQLAISITNIFVIVALFNLSTYYVSDTKDEYRIENYLGAQIITCFLSVLFCTVYVFACGYSSKELYCIITYMACRAIETFAGFLFAIDQRNYRMDYVGISLSLRGIFDFIVFTIILYFTQNIVFASISMSVVTLGILLLYDFPRTRNFSSLKPSLEFDKVLELLKESFLSVLAIAIFTAINTVPRQFLEKMYGEEVMGYYATIASPIVVIQVIAISIFNPILRDVAVEYRDNGISKLRSIAIKVLSLLIGLALIGIVGASFFGEFVYTLMYGEAIGPYCYLIYAVIGCTALYAACWACWNMLIIMRKTRIMLVLSVISLAISVLFSRFFIDAYFMNGVSFIIMLAYGLFFIVSSIYIYASINRNTIDN